MSDPDQYWDEMFEDLDDDVFTKEFHEDSFHPILIDDDFDDDMDYD